MVKRGALQLIPSFALPPTTTAGGAVLVLLLLSAVSLVLAPTPPSTMESAAVSDRYTPLMPLPISSSSIVTPMYTAPVILRRRAWHSIPCLLLPPITTASASLPPPLSVLPPVMASDALSHIMIPFPSLFLISPPVILTRLP